MDEGILGTAMQGAGFLSRLTFSWVDPLLQKGKYNAPHFLKSVSLISFLISLCELVGCSLVPTK